MTPSTAPPVAGFSTPNKCGTISVIIPIWRDLEALSERMKILRASDQVRETIVSLAEPNPELIARIKELGAAVINAGAPNRGRQLDLGASVATGNWLLFHHADSQLTPEHLRALGELDLTGKVVGGAFYRRFDERHPRLRPLEKIERWHNRSFGALYGDQSIFVRRELFAGMGGFRGLPLMEDVDFSLRLRRAGWVVLLDPPMASSPRRHLTRGPWRMTFTNLALLIFFRLGVSPHRLHAWYYRARASGACPDANSCAAAAALLPATPTPHPLNKLAS